MHGFLREMRNRVRAFFNKAPLDRELEQELSSHLDELVAEICALSGDHSEQWMVLK